MGVSVDVDLGVRVRVPVPAHPQFRHPDGLWVRPGVGAEVLPTPLGRMPHATSALLWREREEGERGRGRRK